MIATAALAAAWLSGRDPATPGRWAGWIAVGLLLGLLGAAKIPLILLAALPAWLGRRCGRAVAGLAGTMAALLVSLGWLVAGALPVMGGLQRAGVSPPRQLAWLLAHPLHALQGLIRTLQVFGPTLVRETIGVLGLLDTVLPASFYLATLLCVAVACGAEAWPGVAPSRCLRLPVATSLGVGAILAGSVLLVFAIFDLVWTPVGASLIEGVQGRYLLPPLLFTILLLPRLDAWRPQHPAGLRLAAGFALLCWSVVPATVLARFG